MKVLCLILVVTAVVASCDCGSTGDNSGDANPTDDDVIADDDTSADDDIDDDGSTTTTTPTTTTTGGTGTTTTVTSPSTTTTTIPGSGTACDPFRYTAADGPDVPDFGPWPEYTIGAITYRQYVAGSAGIGRSSVALDAEGRAWVFGMVGRSFDAYIFDDDGSVERQIVDPAGGFNSTVSRDATGAFQVVYTNNNLTEIRYATNAGGEWVRTLLLAVPQGGTAFGAALAEDGTIHVAYTCLEWDNVGMRYFRWLDGSILLEEQIQEPEDDVSLWGPSLALDSTGQAVVAHGGEAGIWVHERTDAGWASTPLGARDGETAVVIDSADVAHVAFGDWSSRMSYATNAGGDWNAVVLDPCSAGAVQFQMWLGASDALHLVYASRTYAAIRHATNAGGTWTFEQSDRVPGYYLGSAIAADGSVHTASCAIGLDVNTFVYATNESGTWTRRRVAGGKVYAGTNIAVDAEGALHMVFAGTRDSDSWTEYYAKADADNWSLEVLDSDAIDAEPGIAVDSSGRVHVEYVDRESDYKVEYAVRDDDGWMFDIAHDADPNEGIGFLSTDIYDQVFIGYTFGDNPIFLTREGTNWDIDVVPFVGDLQEMKIDNDSTPHLLMRTKTAPYYFKHIWKSNDATWHAESAFTPTSYAYSWLDADIDQDGKLHSLYCCDSVTGVGYASNRSGLWLTEPIGRWAYDRNTYALVADDLGNVHVALMSDETRPGLYDGFYLYYATNIDGEFEFYSIDDRWTMTTHIEMAMDESDNIVIGYEAMESICTATFAPGLE